MTQILKKEKAHFRIIVVDIQKKKSKTVSLTNHSGKTIDDIVRLIKKAFI